MNFENSTPISSTQYFSHHQGADPPAAPTSTLTFAMDESPMMLMTNNENANSNGLGLKQQVMLNQFMTITGCTFEQSRQLLIASNWQYQTALSMFFDEYHININKPSLVPLSNNSSTNNLVCLNNLSICAPSNTPVTPPNLEFLERAFSKLNSSSNFIQQSVPQTQFNNNNNIINNQIINSNNEQYNLSNTNTTTNTSIMMMNNNVNTTRMLNGTPIQKTMPMPINPASIFYHTNPNSTSNF